MRIVESHKQVFLAQGTQLIYFTVHMVSYVVLSGKKMKLIRKPFPALTFTPNHSLSGVANHNPGNIQLLVVELHHTSTYMVYPFHGVLPHLRSA